MTSIPPGLILIFAGLLLPFVSGRARDALLLGAPALALAIVWMLPDGVVLSFANPVAILPGIVAGTPSPTDLLQLQPLKVDALSRLFATVFTIMAGVGGLFALSQSNTRELAAAFVYAGGAVSVVFCGDLISLFVFWELMAIASVVVIWSGGPKAHGAGLRYAAIHLLGGVLLMAGIAGHLTTSGNIAFTSLTDSFNAGNLSAYLILAGILINAAAVPMAAWLPDAYPEASWSGMVFLSAFTTKTAVYTLIRGFPGTEILIWIGVAMVFYGIVWAILENDMRRILAYSIVNQVGFMVTGVGIGTEMALNGAAAHAFVHIIYKALLLMSAGSVLYMTGKRKCTDLGGLYRTMPLTCVCGTIGALAISAFPFTSGFPAKSMISQAAADGHMAFVWFALAAASAGVFLHAGIKFPWFVFFQKDSGMRPDEKNGLPWNMKAAMVIFAVACIVIGVFPNALLYSMLPYPVDYVPYTGAHVVYQLQLLLFSGLAFFLMLGLLKRTMTITLDFDWLYRRFGRLLAKEFDIASGNAWADFTGNVTGGARRLTSQLYKHYGPDGILGRAWPTGNMAFWTTVVLGGSMLLYFM